MGLVDAFVAEGGAELKDLVYAAYYETLEPELGSDSHGEGAACCAFEAGHEGAGYGAAGVFGEDGGLELEEVSGVEEVTDVFDDVGSEAEGVDGFAVGEEVDVAVVEAEGLVEDLEGEGD